VIFETEMLNFDWEFHCFELEFDCALWDGSRPIAFPFETTYQCKDDAGNVCFEMDVHCQSLLIFPHCPGPCTGPSTQSFDVARLTEGWTDNTRTTQVPAIISGEEHLLPFDTIKVTSDMIMSDTSNVVDLFFRMSQDPQNENSAGALLDYLNAEVTVTPAGGAAGAPIALGAPTTGTGQWGNETTWDVGAVTGPLNDGDEAVVCAFFTVTNDFTDSNYYEVETFRGEFYTFDENRPTEEVSCDNWGERVYYEDISIRHSTVSNTFIGCESGKLDSYLIFDGSVGEQYPDEYRPMYRFNRLAFYVDPTLTWLGTFT